MRRDSSAGIAAGYTLDDRGSISGRGKIFLCSTASRPALGPIQPHLQWIPGAKRPKYESNHSYSSSAEVKNTGAIPPLSYMSYGIALN
jgi:hypothetical protein